MTAQTAEIPAVTDHTTRLIQVQFAGGMVAEETGYMTGGLQRGILGVALLATEGIVDFGVTDDAIGHLGHGGRRDVVGFRKSAVAGLTGIRRVQMAADVARRLQVGLLVDGSRKYRRQVSHLEVLDVAKGHDSARRRRRNLHLLMALAANRVRREQIVGCLGAGRGRRVTGDALQLQAKMELMRERRSRL